MYVGFDALRNDVDYEWQSTAAPFSLKTDDLILMHAATPGTEVSETTFKADGIAGIGDGIPCRLGPGTYTVETAIATVAHGSYELESPHRPGERFTFNAYDAEYPLCRFKPLD